MAKLSRKQVGMLQEEFVKAGIMRDPNSYTADELKDLCPNVPHWFIDDHVAVRDGKKKQSDYKKIKIDLNKF
jgi:hypothetical protein